MPDDFSPVEENVDFRPESNRSGTRRYWIKHLVRQRIATAHAGANLLVTGSAVFGSAEPAAAYARIAAAAGAS